jgi:hypothetical protein
MSIDESMKGCHGQGKNSHLWGQEMAAVCDWVVSNTHLMGCDMFRACFVVVLVVLVLVAAAAVAVAEG